MLLEDETMKLLLTLLISVYLSGCTVAGVLIDGHAQNNDKLNQNMNSKARSDPYKDPFKPIPKDREGFSFTKFESPRVHRRPVCLSQATLPDSFKLS